MYRTVSVMDKIDYFYHILKTNYQYGKKEEK